MEPLPPWSMKPSASWNRWALGEIMTSQSELQSLKDRTDAFNMEWMRSWGRRGNKSQHRLGVVNLWVQSNETSINLVLAQWSFIQQAQRGWTAVGGDWSPVKCSTATGSGWAHLTYGFLPIEWGTRPVEIRSCCWLCSWLRALNNVSCVCEGIRPPDAKPISRGIIRFLYVLPFLPPLLIEEF